MKIYIALNLISIFSVPIYFLFYAMMYDSEKLFSLNQNILLYTTLFAFVSYFKSYSMPNFYFKYFNIAKGLVFV